MNRELAENCASQDNHKTEADNAAVSETIELDAKTLDVVNAAYHQVNGT